MTVRMPPREVARLWAIATKLAIDFVFGVIDWWILRGWERARSDDQTLDDLANGRPVPHSLLTTRLEAWRDDCRDEDQW